MDWQRGIACVGDGRDGRALHRRGVPLPAEVGQRAQCRAVAEDRIVLLRDVSFALLRSPFLPRSLPLQSAATPEWGKKKKAGVKLLGLEGANIWRQIHVLIHPLRRLLRRLPSRVHLRPGDDKHRLYPRLYLPDHRQDPRLHHPVLPRAGHPPRARGKEAQARPPRRACHLRADGH